MTQDVTNTYGWPLTPAQRRLAVAHLGGEQQAALECLHRCAVWEDCRCAPSNCPHWPVGIQCRNGAFVFPEPPLEVAREESRGLTTAHRIIDEVAAKQRRRGGWPGRLQAWWAADPGGVVCAAVVMLAALYLAWQVAVAIVAGRL